MVLTFTVLRISIRDRKTFLAYKSRSCKQFYSFTVLRICATFTILRPFSRPNHRIIKILVDCAATIDAARQPPRGIQLPASNSPTPLTFTPIFIISETAFLSRAGSVARCRGPACWSELDGTWHGHLARASGTGQQSNLAIYQDCYSYNSSNNEFIGYVFDNSCLFLYRSNQKRLTECTRFAFYKQSFSTGRHLGPLRGGAWVL